MGAIRTAGFWFTVLAAACVVVPYLIGLSPATPRQRRAVAITIAFLAWILLMMVGLRSS